MTPTRRDLLRIGGVIGVSALAEVLLGGRGHHRHRSASAAAHHHDDIGVAEQRLLAAYEAVMSQFPALGPLLEVVVDHHRVHAQSLGAAPVALGPAPILPVGAHAALTLLQALELNAMKTRRAQAVARRADGGLLAAIAAAEAVHADLLGAALGAISTRAAPNVVTTTATYQPVPSTASVTTMPTVTPTVTPTRITSSTHPPPPTSSSPKPTTSRPTTAPAAAPPAGSSRLALPSPPRGD